MTWREKFDDRFDGNASAAARELAKVWRRVDAKAAKTVNERSLGTRIGELLAGNAAWWLKDRRSKLRQAFGDLLDVDVAELFGATVHPPSALGFPEFPALAPLGRIDEPCRLMRGGWLLHAAVAGLFGRDRAPRRRWVVAPPGAGKSLTIRYLVARHSNQVRAASVETLEDVVALSSIHAPLVVEVERASPHGDVAAVAKINARAHPTVVLSPFAFPEPTWSGPGATVSRAESGWEVVAWSLAPGWRARLLAWVDRRVEDTDHDGKVRAADVEEWLARTDPRGTLFATPGDVLALCAEFDAFGPGHDSLKERAARWARQVAPTMIPVDAPTTWRASGIDETLSALAHAHLTANAYAYGHLDRVAWQRIDGTSSRSKSVPEDDGARITYLEQAGLLRGGERGLVVYPTWVERGLVMTSSASALARHALEWGALAADESRRATIDACLDALPRSTLMRVARNVAAPAEPSLHATAVVEGLCAALARRCANPDLRLTDEDAVLVRALLVQQIEYLVVDGSYGKVHHPLTRPDIDEWFATAWTLSLRVSPPAGFARHDLAWQLPGWVAELTFDELPAHRFPATHFAGNPSSTTPMPGLVLASGGTTFTELDVTDGLAGVCPADVERVARLSLAVVERIAPASVPATVPRLLLPALFLSDRGWNLGVEHFKRLHGSWEESFFLAVAETRDADERAKLARRLWELAAREVVPDGAVPIAERVGLLLRQHAGLAAFVLTNLAGPTIREDAARCGTHRRPVGAGGYHPSDPHLLLHLPRAGREAALRGWLDGAAARGARFDEARELVPLLDADDVDLALELVRSADRFVAAEFTAFVWTTWPERAREEATIAVDRALPSCEGWFHSAPRAELAFVAGLVTRFVLRPEWIAAWARRRLLDAGPAGEKLFALLTVNEEL